MHSALLGAVGVCCMGHPVCCGGGAAGGTSIMFVVGLGWATELSRAGRGAFGRGARGWLMFLLWAGGLAGARRSGLPRAVGCRCVPVRALVSSAWRGAV